MRVFIQIPCLNEEQTLPLVLEKMPKTIPGADEVELLIIDDGCSDRTVEVARSLGVKHFVHHAKPMGLARAFRDGVDYALKHGADIVVNTDGDNQYPSETIGDLVQPIIRHEADIVVGDRQTATIKEFSWFKRRMQAFGSWVVNLAAGTHIPDAASGFRAYSKSSLLKLNIVTEFSYCMETIIQAGNKRIAITSYAIKTNPKTRESRLFSNIFEHMAKSGGAIIRSFLMFKANVIFKWAAIVFGILGLIPFVRYLMFFFSGHSAGHLQSMLAGVALIMLSAFCVALQIISEVLRIQRKLVEDELERTKELMYCRESQRMWAQQDEWGGYSGVSTGLTDYVTQLGAKKIDDVESEPQNEPQDEPQNKPVKEGKDSE
ncbi:glycosyl transferase [Bifidobacterium sp. UTCIF-37]|uniref:glycosyltransferase family 2 protein n=1 Tax=unclassified Bifidobacterium TaxID=2608897 RepID=UPI0011299374|nr:MULTISPECIES: glycosyltransferase family 2 protein [unclassified Bifidobacterium]TPF85367.1 glycosyl transferase [Bifidobacterium sp. UTCIF-37]TPF89246.1 glycosyl transferase [Bifidobacterium sp. UTCIF-38]